MLEVLIYDAIFFLAGFYMAKSIYTQKITEKKDEVLKHYLDRIDELEAKINNQVTKEDIKAWANKIANIQCRNFAELGAMAMLDNEIKHIEK